LELVPSSHLVVIVDNFYFSRSLFSPMKADSILIIDPDAEWIITLFPLQYFQTIPWRYLLV